MINEKLINPESIVIVGGSNNIQKPGGKVLKNILDGDFSGKLYVSNPREDVVQGIKSYRNAGELPQVDLAIIAVAAKLCPDITRLLANEKGTRAFIILSAGFGEESEDGARLENEILDIVNSVNGTLIGPNCIGVLNQNYNGVFTTPIPKLEPKGVDFISGSGATAVFIMESAIPKGLKFSNVYSVGNSAQIGVEDILKYMDENFDPENSATIKLLYIESIQNPQMLLKHAASLINKGCKIAAIKAGASEAGSRAASSHTGALSSPDAAVETLFRKAGVVRCHGREELATVAAIFMHPPLKGNNLAIITHAGGPAVMLTDVLADNGMEVPPIKGPESQELLKELHPGSSVANPIDFLATGTGEQLGKIIDYCYEKFSHIDGMAVIFGSPGLLPVHGVYDILHQKMEECEKPIYPILPSVINAKDEIEHFISHGRINFPEEVIFGQALGKIFNTPAPASGQRQLSGINTELIRSIVDDTNNGYLHPDQVRALLDAAGIKRAGEATVSSRKEAIDEAERLGFPVVMKVIGPVHKSDVNGIALNITDKKTAAKEYDRMISIRDATGILIQPMLKGTEIFIGAKKENKFGHIVLCGIGGIFIEVLKDISRGLAPIDPEEAKQMIHNLEGYGMIQGTRGQEGVSEEAFAEAIMRISALVENAPEIAEMDINPLLGSKKDVTAVDARIRIEKQ
ncbi:MAG: acetate--CoA ligase family protein [Bacteroidales bacterium]|nr:acetate--CoA ligase family protein [Bacteroidales bacterium]MBS3774485.1 acetate--CoA ligase family protein [Bacteroidales bacterium]